jgi:hypothetical protein
MDSFPEFNMFSLSDPTVIGTRARIISPRIVYNKLSTGGASTGGLVRQLHPVPSLLSDSTQGHKACPLYLHWLNTAACLCVFIYVLLLPVSGSLSDDHVIGQALGLASHTKADGTSDLSRPGMALFIGARLVPGTGMMHLISRDKEAVSQSLRLAWDVVRTRATRIRQLLGITTPLPDLAKMDVPTKVDPFGLCKNGTSGKQHTRRFHRCHRRYICSIFSMSN